MAAPRVAPPRVFPEAAAAPRPPQGFAGAVEAHRQTSFALGPEVELVVEGLNLEGRAAEASSDARHRSQLHAALLGQWSRSWLCRLQALHAVQWGNYAAAVPLVRASADCQAALLYLFQTGGEEWTQWLDEGGIALAPADHATQFRLHAFRAAEILAAHATLGPIYRAAMDLSLPHFGSTLLLAGNESDATRVAMTFGDRDFTLGLAELVLGWLELLGAAQLEAVLAQPDVFACPEPDAAAAWASKARDAASRSGRCSIESVERDGEKRYLVQNWRRTASAAAKKLLL